MKQYTIPVFVPELACPNRCIYCDQKQISGEMSIPSRDAVINTIEEHLSSFKDKNARVEIGFFGGNFTGIDIEQQKMYLDIAQVYCDKNLIDSIRMSTRPDYISQEILNFLKQYSVETIELGIQTLDDDILKVLNRGHKAEQSYKAMELIVNNDFKLGFQMMIGLPNQSYQQLLSTAQAAIDFKASCVRIYPLLVLKNTELANLYNKKEYITISLNTAVNYSADLLDIFDKNEINVIRLGLHPSESLVMNSLIDGPFHPSFRELVETERWRRILVEYFDKKMTGNYKIYVNPKQINFAIGYSSSNRKKLESNEYRIEFLQDSKLKNKEFYVDNN